MYDRIKFIYFSHQTLQIPRVARQCIVSLCDAVSQLGAEAEVVSFRTKLHPSEPKHEEFHQLYDVDNSLHHTSYPILKTNPNNKGNFSEIQRFFVYTLHFMRYLFNSSPNKYRLTVLCARNYSILFMLSLLKKISSRKIIVLAEVQGMPLTRFAMLVHKKVNGNVCISESLKKALQEKTGLEPDKFCVAHQGVRIECFINRNESKRELREKLNLPLEKKILCYAGKVHYRYQEIDYYLRVAELLEDTYLMLIVGGRPDHVRKWQRECKRRNICNVEFRSFVPPREIPGYLKAADLLLMYYSPSALNDYRSPGKLFEYLASGVPLVACRTDSMEEIIEDGETGFFVEPYKPDLLKEKIVEILSKKDLLESVALKAKKRAEEFSWRRRAKAFLDYAVFLSESENEKWN